MSNQQERVVSTRKAAETLGVSVRTVQLWVEAGVLRAWKTAGNHRRIFLSSVEDLIRQRRAGNSSVLIVEDDPTFCPYYQRLFELVEPEVTVEFASNGFEGLVKLGEVKPELMIIDVDVPGMDGLQMLRTMRASDTAVEAHIVIVTSLDQHQLALRGGIPQDIACYEKPLTVQAFEAIIDELPGSHRMRSRSARTEVVTQ